jgi:hypothetical protein
MAAQRPKVKDRHDDTDQQEEQGQDPQPPRDA